MDNPLSSWLKRIAIIASLLLVLLGFVAFQGVQVLSAYFTNDTVRRVPNGVIYPMKLNTCTSSAPIKVLSYNVLYGSDFMEKFIQPLLSDYSAHYQPWSVRAPEIKAHIASYQPDLIGLQETATQEDIDKIAPLSTYTLVSYEKGKFEYGDAALLFRSDRFDLLDSGQFFLSPTPDLPMAFGFKRLSMLRYVNWAMLSDKTSHFKFLFVNTHFDNAGVNKEPSAGLFRERIASVAANLPIIVSGDFNTQAGTERYLRLSGSQENPPLLINSYTLAGEPKVDPAQHPNQRIDHIFTGGPCKIDASAWQIDHWSGKDNLVLSDHDPVMTELSFTPK